MSNIVSPGFTTPWIFREMPGVVSEGGGEGSSCEGRGWMEIPMRKMAIKIAILGVSRSGRARLALRSDEEFERSFPFPSFRTGVGQGHRGAFLPGHGGEEGAGP